MSVYEIGLFLIVGGLLVWQSIKRKSAERTIRTLKNKVWDLNSENEALAKQIPPLKGRITKLKNKLENVESNGN